MVTLERIRTMPLRRLLALVVWLILSNSLQAQLAGNRFSPLNYFGRVQGIGWSDGYHECRDPRFKAKESWLDRGPMSSFYGEPTLPNPNASMTSARSTTPRSRYFPGPTSSMMSNEFYSPSMAPTVSPQSPGSMAPAPAYPSNNDAPYLPSPLYLPQPQPQPESIVPVPYPLIPSGPMSPSDRMPSVTPAPRNPNEPLPPPNQTRRLPSGLRSTTQSALSASR